jgi:hypothetical protein
MHALLDDDLGRLTLRRLRPWHRMLARCLAARLDRQLADGVRPEASATLAARAMHLTSTGYRRDLAGSLWTILAAAGHPAPRPQPVTARSPLADQARPPGGRAGHPWPGAIVPGQGHSPSGLAATRESPSAARGPAIPVSRTRITRSAAGLAGLARRLAAPGPVPAQAVAIVSRLLADGRGPLYRAASPDDLGLIVERAARSLTG